MISSGAGLPADVRERQPILVAGAGIGGLAAAIALARVGVRVVVLEQRQAADEDGAGIQIGPNGVAMLRALGAAELLQPFVAEPNEIVVRDGHSGRRLARLPLAPRMQQRHGAPYWTTRRSDLHRALLTRALSMAAITVEHGFEVTGIDESADGIDVSDSTGRRLSGDALVGADGLWSIVAPLRLGAQSPHFAGRTAARAMLPADALPPVFGGGATGIWLGPRTHLVHYPVDAGRAVNIVAISEGGPQSRDWGAPIDPADLLPAFAGWSAEVHSLFRLPGQWRRWSLMERAPLAEWSRGRVTLLGDAAHPILPFLAQGAVLALEDSIALAAAVEREPSDLAVAFRAYSSGRVARAARVVDASRGNGRIYHLSGAAAAARNLAMRVIPPDRLIARYDWLYGYR